MKLFALTLLFLLAMTLNALGLQDHERSAKRKAKKAEKKARKEANRKLRQCGRKVAMCKTANKGDYAGHLMGSPPADCDRYHCEQYEYHPKN